MDKNENGSTAQFSPEELIRRLKSQLNINTEQEAEEPNVTDKESDSTAAPVNEIVESAGKDNDDDEVDEIVVENVDSLEDISDEEIDAEVVDFTVKNDEDLSADGGSTVEFSISSLFDNSDSTNDSVKEVDIEVAEKQGSSDDDLDFLSFLAASGISAKKQNVEDVIEETESDLVDDLSDIAEELSETPEPVTNAEEAVESVAEDLCVEAEVLAETDSAEDEVDTVCEPEVIPEEVKIDENAEIIEAENDDSASYESLDDTVDAEIVSESHEENAVSEVETAEDDELDYSFDDETAVKQDSSDDGKAIPDFNMLIALGIPVAEVEKIYGEEAAEEYTRLTEGTNALDDLSDDEEEYEYTSRSQNEEIEAHHKSEKKLSFVKLCAAAVLFIIALLYENLPALGAEYSGWMDQSAFPVVHIMVDLQLVLFAAVLAWDELVSGIKALLHRSANVGTVLAAAVVINVLCDIVLCFSRVAKYEVKLAGASVIFAVLMCLGISALRLFAETKAFAVISKKGTRACVLTESVDDVRERNAFFDKISKDEASSAKVLSFGKTKFVSGFFRNQSSDRATVVDKILAPAAVVGAIIAFVIAYAVSKSVGIGLYTLNCATAFLVPVSVFAAGTITYAKAANYAEGMKAAIIGENAPYDLADSSVVAFEDRDAYPSYCVKLRNLKVYGNIAIVDVLRMTTTAFRKIGGPLSDVLESATSEVNKDIPVDIVKSCEGGVEAVYQGQRLLIGKADFLHSYGIIPYSDVDDREYLKTGDVSIMYVAYGDELSAKFYIQYTLDVDFEELLRDLNRAGICVSIRTSDPNIDKRLLQAKLNLNKTSLRIVYREPADGRSEPTEETASAVVGTGTPSELIHTAMLCDRVVHVYRTNTIVKALSLVIGLALLVLFALISVNVNVFSGLLIVYQLFWMIPTLIVSKLFL